jgi:DeoR/GlpR family transcriptional regulator of sugar metabolism
MKKIFFLLLSFITYSLSAQDYVDKETILTVGGNFHPAANSFFGEAGVMISRLETSHGAVLSYKGI